jgi:PEP-CTERM motif
VLWINEYCRLKKINRRTSFMQTVTRTLGWALLGLTTIVSGQAKANLIVVDADAFPAGTVLNNAFPDVTLTAIGDSGVLANDNVLSATSSFATTGSRVFADTSGSPTAWGDGSFSYLRADFAGGTTMVLLDFASDDASDSNPYLRAYDSSGTLLDSDSAGSVALGSFVTLQVSAPNIAYIEASWDDVNRTDNGILDNLRYESAVVPEPSTLAVAGVVGFFGLAYRWRRSKRPSA